MATDKTKEHFLALTGVRALAAYMVYLHHSSSFVKNTFGNNIYDLARELHIGVTLFFVLSGFLIAYRYLTIENIPFKKYMVNRFSRIYPMYFIVTSITFLVYNFVHKASGNYSFGVYILNITFIRGFFKDFIFSGISQGWTLTIEETFYLFAPLIFTWIRRYRIGIFFLPVLFLFIGLLLVLCFHTTSFFGFFASLPFMINGTFFGRCIEFFVGIGLAWLLLNKIQWRIFKFKSFTYLGLLMIALGVYSLIFIKHRYNLETGILHPYGMLINTTLLPLFGVATFYYGLISEKTICSRILSSPLFILLGKSSYIFYLIHVGLLPMLLNKVIHSQILIFICLNIIAIIAYKFLEDPANTYLRRRLNKSTDKKHRVLLPFFTYD